MGARIDLDRVKELVRLHRQGSSGRETARLLRLGQNTQRRYCAALAAAGLLDGLPDQLPDLDRLRAAIRAAFPPRPVPEQASSAADRWSELEWMFDRGIPARVACDRLRLETKDDARPFRASYSSVKRAYRAIRRRRGLRPEDVAVPVDTGPGEVAQVDLGYAGKFYDPAAGVLRRAWVFVWVMAFSRMMFVRLVLDQKVETWLSLHEQALAAMGGVVETVVPDNLKRAVLRASFGIDGRTELERSYRELARHYGFKIDPTPPGAPRKKGKAEAAVKFVKRALAGLDGQPVDQAQALLLRWNQEVASQRLHGSLGVRPLDLLEEERRALRPLPAKQYERVIWKRARVHPDSHVAFDGRLYSVPWQLIGQDVWIRARPSELVAYHQDQSVAVHARTHLRRTTVEEHLPEGRRDLRHRARAFWEARAESIGPATLALVRRVFDADEVLSHLRQVQAIIGLLERHPPARAEATSTLVFSSGDPTYHKVKAVLAQALDCPPS